MEVQGVLNAAISNGAMAVTTVGAASATVSRDNTEQGIWSAVFDPATKTIRVVTT